MISPDKHKDIQHLGKSESESVSGRLMAVDWANGIARLDTPEGDSVMLRFSIADIDMENRMRKLATCHVDVLGYPVTGGDSGKFEAITVQEISHAWLEPEPSKEPEDGPISDVEWEEFRRVIREGRDGLCGECRRRRPVAKGPIT